MELQEGTPNPKDLEDVQQQAEKQDEITDNIDSTVEGDEVAEQPDITEPTVGSEATVDEDADLPAETAASETVEVEPEQTEEEATPEKEPIASTTVENELHEKPADSEQADTKEGKEAEVESVTQEETDTQPTGASDATVIAEADLPAKASEPEAVEVEPKQAEEEARPENEPIASTTVENEAHEKPAGSEQADTKEGKGAAEVETVRQGERDTQPTEVSTAEKPSEKEAAGDDATASEGKEVEEELEDIDFSVKSKAELIEFAADLNQNDPIQRLDKYLKPLKASFDKLFIQERQTALDAFVAEGNESDDFEFRGDDETKKFQDYFDLLREKRNRHYAALEKSREENLKRKEEILENIRELIDGEETDISIKAVRELQNEWKKVGPVPGQHNKTLWANYNALLDRFYDARSIYFELKDLDRKKNLQSKIELCEKAEALDVVESVKDAVVQLNELHEEFKHVGPIPRDQQEDIWQRFKAASDKIYVKRKGYVEDLKKAFVENLDKKTQLVEEVEQFTKFDSDRISAWNKKTKEIQALQKKWEAVGGIPREKAKEVNKRFWAGFKGFFANKSAFFKKFEAQRGDNLKIKQGLVEEAKTLQESTDWVATTDKYKRLQARWKEVGPVPEKYRTSIYEEFKVACDHFFEQRRAQNQEQNQEQEVNLKVKMQACDSLESEASAEKVDLDVVYGLLDQYHEAGFVPRNSMKKVQNRFAEVTKKLLGIDSIGDDDRQDLKINIEVGKIKGGPHADRKIFRKENSLRRKIDKLESDISTWKNNLEFFASSKAADQLKKDFEEKIVKASDELGELKKELRLLHNA